MKKIIFIGCVVSLVFFSCKKDEKEDIEDGFSFPLKKVNVIGTNGLVEHQGKLWVADLLGAQIIGFDQQTGKIFATYLSSINQNKVNSLDTNIL